MGETFFPTPGTEDLTLPWRCHAECHGSCTAGDMPATLPDQQRSASCTRPRKLQAGSPVGRPPLATAPTLTRRRPAPCGVLVSGWARWSGWGGSRSYRPLTALPPRPSRSAPHSRPGRRVSVACPATGAVMPHIRSAAGLVLRSRRGPWSCSTPTAIHGRPSPGFRRWRPRMPMRSSTRTSSAGRRCRPGPLSRITMPGPENGGYLIRPQAARPPPRPRSRDQLSRAGWHIPPAPVLTRSVGAGGPNSGRTRRVPPGLTCRVVAGT